MSFDTQTSDQVGAVTPDLPFLQDSKTTAHAGTGHYWIPPGSTRATRVPSIRSRAAARGALIGGLEPRAIVFESVLEEKTAHVLLARRDVIDIEDQPPAVRYVDQDGIERTHTFDFRAIKNDGSRVAVSVKPKERAERKNFAGTLALIASQVPASFADLVVLVTEDHLGPDAVYNAKLIHAVRRDRERPHDQAVGAVVAGLNGRASIEALVQATGFGANAFRALVRLISDGAVTVHTPGRIDYHTVLSPQAGEKTGAHS